MAQTPEERKAMLTREARKLAEDQGLEWEDLPRERRKELKQQVRETKRAGRKVKTAE